MHPLLITYCILIAIASALGGSLPAYVRLTHRRIQMILSLVSGVMLGVALLHLLPHSIAVLEDAKLALMICLVGLLFMFFLIRTFHFHQHDTAVETGHDHAKKDLCDHHQGHSVHCEQHDGSMDLSWVGLCFGLATHTLLDGIALAAAVQIESHADLKYVAGLSVFLAIVLHKPLDAMSITSLMAARGWDPTRQLVVNVVFSLMCPLGAILFAISVDLPGLKEYREWYLGLALAFSAGIFLCISLGDLLPEVHFHSHDRLTLSVMLVSGVLIAFGIESLPGHEHGKTLDVKDVGVVDEETANRNPPATDSEDGEASTNTPVDNFY